MKKVLLIGLLIALFYFLKKASVKKKENNQIQFGEKQEASSGRSNPNSKTVQEWIKILKPNYKETGNIYGIADIENDERLVISTGNDGNEILTIPSELLNNRERAQYEVNSMEAKDSKFGRVRKKKKGIK